MIQGLVGTLVYPRARRRARHSWCEKENCAKRSVLVCCVQYRRLEWLLYK